jgi:Peptidase family M1 domain
MTPSKLSLTEDKLVSHSLWAGVLSGLAFAMAAWGFNGLALARAHAALPWVPLQVGGFFALLVGGITGWISGRLKGQGTRMLAWLFGGIVLAWLVYYQASQGYILALQAFSPASNQDIPYHLSLLPADNLLVAYGGMLIAGLLGALLTRRIRASVRLTSRSNRAWVAALILAYAVGGFIVDSAINRPIREPILQLNRAILEERIDGSAKGAFLDHQSSYQLYLADPGQPGQDTRVIWAESGNVWAKCTFQNTDQVTCDIAAAQPVASKTIATEVSTPTTTAVPETSAPATNGVQSQDLSRVVLPGVHTDSDFLQLAPRYAISLTVNLAGHQIEGREAIDYTNAENVALDRLYLRLLPNGHGSYGDGSMKVSQTLLDGKTISPTLSLNDSILEVTLPVPLQPGEGARLELSFSGDVPLDFGGEATPAGYGIYNYSNSIMALANWYPILSVYDAKGWHLDPVSDIGDSVYSDTAFYTVDISAPTDVKVAATGSEISATAIDAKTIRHHYLSGPARDFFIIMSPDFQSVEQVVDGTTINSYFIPAHKSGGMAALQVAAASLKIYNQHFGAYPFREFDIAEAPMRYAAGVEYPGIVIIGDFLYDQPNQPNFEVAVAHEVAHQWWYNVVGNDVFAEPWLDEALTTYTSSMYYEFGPAGESADRGLISYWEDRYQKVIQAGKDDAVNQSLAHFESLNDPTVYSYVVYSKGALFFEALRQKIGDQAYFTALRNYFQEYQFRIASGDDLLKIFEQAAGQPLGDFYRNWLNYAGS